MIFLLERTIINMEIDFDKMGNSIKNNRKQIENKTENIENDCQKMNLRIEEYRYFNTITSECVEIKLYTIY